MTRRWLAPLLLLLAACGAAPSPRPQAATPTPAPTAPTTTAAPPTSAAALAHRSAPPARIRIPAIGVSAAVVRLGLKPDGTLEVPSDFDDTGWYTGGPAPGETGPAVIAGHIDSHRGPAVFYRLRELRPGDEITVGRTDGSSVRFTVDAIAQYPQAGLPDRGGVRPLARPDPAAHHLWRQLRPVPAQLPGQRRGHRPAGAVTPA